MTLTLSGFRAVVKIHVPAKFHQAECSGSWVIVLTEKKKLRRKRYCRSLPRIVTNAGNHINSPLATNRSKWSFGDSGYCDVYERAAIHGAECVAVRCNQHPVERLQQLPRLRHDVAGANVSLRSRRSQVRQQVLASRTVLRHRLHRLRLRRHLHLASWPWTAVRLILTVLSVAVLLVFCWSI